MPNKENRVKNQGPRKANRRMLFFITCSLLLVFFFFPFSLNAQCAMCRAAIESEGNTGKAEAINDGIVYLMVIPYLLIGAIGFAIYRMRKDKKKE
jgi:amino acid permease